MKKVKITDLKVTVKEAIEMAGGSQSELARMLGATRAAVNSWVKSPRRHIPTEQAYRLRWHYGVNGNPAYKVMVREWLKGNDAK